MIFANYFIKLLDHGVNFPIKRKKTKKVPFSKRIICKAENKKNFTKTPPKKANLSNPPQYITLELIFWLVLKWEVLFWLLMLKLEALLLLLLDPPPIELLPIGPLILSGLLTPLFDLLEMPPVLAVLVAAC